MGEYAQARQDAYHNGDYEAIERIIDAEAAGVLLTPEPITRIQKGTIHHVDPGAGAIAYALEHVTGLEREEAAPIIRKLFAGLPTEKRVKRCDYCGYPFRDDSLRNTKRTCSDGCKTRLKTLQRQQQRADKTLLSGKTKKKTKRETNYVWWLEYPFWLDEYEMLKNTWKHEAAHDAKLLDYIHCQNEIYGKGNHKVKAHVPGAEDEQAGKKFNAWTIAKMRDV